MKNYDVIFDIDDTIANLHDPFCNNIKPFLIGSLDPSKIYDPEWMIANLDPKLAIKTYQDWYDFMFSEVLKPADFMNFEPIEGAIDFIRLLYYRSYDINFCSRIISYKDYPEVKYNWLKKYLPDIDFDLMVVSNTSTKKLLRCYHIIDDSVIIAKECSHALVPVKPWNEEFLNKNEDVFRFNNFDQLEVLF